MATVPENHPQHDDGPIPMAPPMLMPPTIGSTTTIAAVTPTAMTPADVADLSQPAAATTDVLHVINGEFYAGAERVQDLLANGLPEFGFRVEFACVKLDLFDEMRQSRQAPLYRVPMCSRFDLRAAWKVAGIVQRGGHQLIHAHTVRSAVVAAIAARLAGVPLVYHAHSPASHDTTRLWRNRFNSIVERLSLRGAARIIAVSEAMAEHMIREGFDRERITVVHNGVPFPTSLPDRPAPNGTWTLGTAALFRPRKGMEILLEALAILRRQGVAAHLRAVGPFESREYEAEMARCVRRLGLQEHVSWTGFRRNVTAELLKMDLFVLPSLFGEGLPMVVLEAMAAGVPIVAARVAGVPEAVRDGRDGLLAAPGDPADLARVIGRVVHGEVAWASLRASALARHAQRFSDRGMAAGVGAVYRTLLARPGMTGP
jgi:glycosyltransferase involved in cell wall biosynthesis